MRTNDWNVFGFVAIYSAVGLLVRHRAARHFKPGVSAAARLGIGWDMFRRDSYTEEGQSARRWIVVLYLGALPLFMLIAYLLSALARWIPIVPRTA